jgi:LAGLIDADG endonuclease
MSISIHRPTTLRHYSIESLSFFLAGIIDGDGHFSKIPQLVICFHEKDIDVAYFLKKQIQYGSVSKIKNKKAVTFVISHSLGLQKVCSFIHNKLKHKEKIIQYNTRLQCLKNFQLTEKNLFSLIKNSWFAGFFLSDGCFQIKILYREKRKLPEIRLVIQIDQKEKYLLQEIQDEFGGSIGFRVSQNTYYYSSVNFTSAKKIIQYLDKFHLMGYKQTQYVLWRKVYTKIQQNFHLTVHGVKWITNVKKRMSNLAK